MSTTRVVRVGPNQARVIKAAGPAGPPGTPGGVTSVAGLAGVVLPGPLAAALAPFLPGVSDSSLVTGSAAVALAPGQAATRSYGLASAVSNALPAIGLVTAAATAGQPAIVRTAGPLTLADWTGATGSAALQAGAPYFLSDVTPGRIMVAVVTVPGSVVQCVGRALTSDTLLISVGNPLLL